MDRNAISFFGIFLGTLMIALPVQAGTVFAPPEKALQLEPGESYPDSRFGQPPARVQTGTASSFASRAVDEMERSDDPEREGQLDLHKPVAPVTAASDNRDTGRRPAGLEFSAPNRASASVRERAPQGASAAPQAENRKTPTAEMVPPPPSTFARTTRNGADLPSVEATAARNGVQEVALIAGDLGFFPKTVFVSRDVPVRMFVTGASKNTLCIMMDSFQVRRQVRSQKIEEVTFTPNVPGKYRFYCPVNGMEGTLVVKEFASNTATAGTE